MTTDIYDRLLAIGSSVVSDVLDEAGFAIHALDPALRSIGPARAFCGPATVVRGERRAATRTSPAPGAIMPIYALPTMAPKGAVLAFAAGGFRGGAVMGGMLAADLAEAGCAAVLTDGLIRDADALAAGPMPVVAMGATPVNGARRFQIAAEGEPAPFPGLDGATLMIRPGDIILGDADGVVVIPADAAERILDMAEKLAEIENALLTNADGLSMAERARLRGERFGHLEWLRGAR
jgi:4-hydroxy-4-methyl-2-oxoglutarate aldolase